MVEVSSSSSVGSGNNAAATKAGRWWRDGGTAGDLAMSRCVFSFVDEYLERRAMFSFSSCCARPATRSPRRRRRRRRWMIMPVVIKSGAS